MYRSRSALSRIAALVVFAAAAFAASPSAYGAPSRGASFPRSCGSVAPRGHKLAVHAHRISCAKAKRLIIRAGTSYDAPKGWTFYGAEHGFTVVKGHGEETTRYLAHHPYAEGLYWAYEYGTCPHAEGSGPGFNYFAIDHVHSVPCDVAFSLPLHHRPKNADPGRTTFTLGAFHCSEYRADADSHSDKCRSGSHWFKMTWSDTTPQTAPGED
ncbi:MAG TPA: hypothetical protein VHD81_05135 [Mycobacteriales bacterium]|nr:hypothetical protein [Mycobacteriales bacterium]